MRKYLLVFCLFSFLPLSYSQKNHIPWKVSTPEEQGMSSLIFINGLDHLMLDKTNIHSLLVIRNDKIVLDICFPPFKKEYVHDLASVTKSIISLLTGIAIDKGYIKNEDELVMNYFPGYTIKNDTLKKLKIRDLLNMSSGLRCSWYNELCRINLYMYKFTFNDGNVDLQIQDRTNYREALLKGSIVD
jgi:Beta-lactamase